MPFVERLIVEGTADFIALDEVKKWCKVEHALDDDILDNLKEFAIYEAYNFMQNDFEYTSDEGELVLVPIPFHVKLACLMYIAYLYEHRGDEPTDIPPNSMKLLQPYKRLVGL